MNDIDRQTFSTETTWEKIAGFSRALRVGNHIFVAGTTATGSEGVIDKDAIVHV